MAAPDQGNLSTVVFGTSGFSANLMSISGDTHQRDDVPTSHMGTTNAMTFVPADLYDGGEFQFVIQYDGTLSPPVSAAAELITIDWGGAGAGNTTTFQGYLKQISGITAELNGLMTATLTIKVADEITLAA